jgi:multidrug efflux pump subunit AcrB
MSFFVAMTVIPLFCSRFLKAVPHGHGAHGVAATSGARLSWGARFNAAFNRGFNWILDRYEELVRRATARPLITVFALMSVFVLSLGLFPHLGLSFFPRSDAGQFTINLKAPTGSRIELTNEYVSRVEDLIRRTIEPGDFRTTVSNLGVVNDLSSLYTTNSGSYAATIQTQLTDDHKVSSDEYMNSVQTAIRKQFPELRAFVQSGSMVDAVLNTGMPAPIDVQVTSPDLPGDFRFAQQLASQISRLDNVGQVYIPQDMDYPALRMEVDRVHAAELGLTQKDVSTT